MVGLLLPHQPVRATWLGMISTRTTRSSASTLRRWRSNRKTRGVDWQTLSLTPASISFLPSPFLIKRTVIVVPPNTWLLSLPLRQRYVGVHRASCTAHLNAEREVPNGWYGCCTPVVARVPHATCIFLLTTAWHMRELHVRSRCRRKSFHQGDSFN